MSPRTLRSLRIVLAIVASAATVALLMLATFPVGRLKGAAERRLSARFERPVTIGSIARESALTLTPVIRVERVRVPQTSWAGTGDLAAIRLLRVRVPLIPLLLGRFEPDIIAASGVRLDLVRAANGRTNWAKPEAGTNTMGGDAPRLDALGVADAVVRYRDAKQRRAFTIVVRVDPQRGLFAQGRGTVDGAPVTVRARGAAVRGAGDWPFDAAIEGPQLTVRAAGRMAAPLDTDHMRLRIEARADDLKRLDRIIEAGLFGTRPVRLTAEVRHDSMRWQVERLRGTIGRSDLTGRIIVDKVDGRSKLDGAVRFGTLDFDDLASNEGLARAAALERAQGHKLVPNLRINLAKIGKTDGRIGVSAARIVGRRPSALRTINGVLTLDHQRLLVAPLTIGLSRGTIGGRATVEQGGAAEPLVTLALDLTRSSLSALGGGDGIDARVDGRVRLTGRGSTIRAAVGRSSGTIGLAARDGSLPDKLAALLGFDFGRGLLAKDGARAVLRCAIVRLPLQGGHGTFAPLLVDTDRSQTQGAGTLSFPDERIAITLTGAPKGGSVLRLPGTIAASGTLRDPRVVVPRETKSVGNVLKAIGRKLTGRSGPLAVNADCTGLSRQAIGR